MHRGYHRTSRACKHIGSGFSDFDCFDNNTDTADWNPGDRLHPGTSPRDANGVPLPNAAGARNVVVTYTPVPPGGPGPKSGNAMVSVGDNYFYPDELHVTPGTTIEWRYDGGGGETESTHM